MTPVYSFFQEKTLWMFFFLLSPVVITFFSGLSLMLLKDDSKNKRNLAILIWAVCVCVIAYFISDYIYYDPPYPIYRFFDSYSGILVVPLAYYYFAALMQPYKKHGKDLFYWFLPAIVLLPLYLLTLHFGTEYPDLDKWSEFATVIWKPEPFIRFVALIFFALQILFCCYYVWKMRKEYISNLLNTHSSVEKVDLKWVLYIAVLLFLFGSSGIAGIINSDLIHKLVFSLFTSICMFFIFIFGYKQVDIPVTAFPIPNDNQQGDEVELLTENNKNISILKEIEACMETEKIYLKNDLTSQDLAVLLNTNRTYISKAINSQNMSFYDYINKYRIRYAIQLLENYDPHLKLSSISEMCGFKSYHVFCRLFKNETGYLPGEFIKRNH